MHTSSGTWFSKELNLNNEYIQHTSYFSYYITMGNILEQGAVHSPTLLLVTGRKCPSYQLVCKVFFLIGEYIVSSTLQRKELSSASG
jgi:hypothetical protein